jgi:hypothetical protein
MRAGDEGDFVGARDRLRLKTGVDSLRVIAEEDARIRAVRVADPQSVIVGGGTVHVVPARVDDPSIVQHGRMPFIGLVEGENPHVRAGGIHPVQGVAGQGLPGVVTAAEAAATRGHEGQAAIRQGAGIEVVVAPLGEAAQVRPIHVHCIDVEALPLRRVVIRLNLGTLRKGKVDGPGVIGERERRVIAFRQAAGDQIAHGERPPGLLQNVDPAAGNIAVVIEVTEVFVEHLADEAPARHEGNGLAGDQGVLQGHASRHRPDPVIQGQACRLIELIDVTHLRLERCQGGGFHLEL